MVYFVHHNSKRSNANMYLRFNDAYFAPPHFLACEDKDLVMIEHSLSFVVYMYLLTMYVHANQVVIRLICDSWPLQET